MDDRSGSVTGEGRWCTTISAVGLMSGSPSLPVWLRLDERLCGVSGVSDGERKLPVTAGEFAPQRRVPD